MNFLEKIRYHYRSQYVEWGMVFPQLPYLEINNLRRVGLEMPQRRHTRPAFLVSS